MNRGVTNTCVGGRVRCWAFVDVCGCVFVYIWAIWDGLGGAREGAFDRVTLLAFSSFLEGVFGEVEPQQDLLDRYRSSSGTSRRQLEGAQANIPEKRCGFSWDSCV
mmetsp:Transcript_64773/g.104843  ORF Transcript_64773/g.104843 Transcript_64773/m.104843 type:complete len:106 (+) Transcript_64773:659-976(+)